ncbi:MAG: 3-carboxy-cis,cis-muconate cycloisomerase [Polyangiales bacterium]
MSPGLAVFAGVFGRGRVADALDDRALLQALLDVEAGLARALAGAGLTSTAAAQAVTQAAQAERFSLAELAAGSAAAGSPIPALVKALQREVAADHESAIHTGATSQDIVDSALMLLLQRALPHLADDLAACAEAAARLADRHRDSLMPGRTLLQQATPITFGLKAAGWLTALDQVERALTGLLSQRLPVQLGGAAGTLASLEQHGLEVAQLLAAELGLRAPALPWHTLRLPVLTLASELGQIAAVSGKIARDVGLLAQSEVAEVREPAGAGRGASSTMPHKQNPVGSVAALSCSRRVPGLLATLFAAAEQEHERAAGAWHAEWEPLIELARLTGSAVSWLRDVLEGLQVDTARMRANLDAARGLPLAERLSGALTPALGKRAAQALVADASARAIHTQRTLADVLREEPELTRVLEGAGLDHTRISSLLDPTGYLGSTQALIDRALALHHTPRDP